MKPVLIALAVLLLVILGFAWLNGRTGIKPQVVQNTGEKQIFFEPEGKVELGRETTLEIKANYAEGAVVSFNLEFLYDPAVMKISGVEINKEVFDKVVQLEVDDKFGALRIQAAASKPAKVMATGVQSLAAVKINGLKKGGMIMSSGRRPEVGVWQNQKVVEGNFQFSGFKVTVL